MPALVFAQTMRLSGSRLSCRTAADGRIAPPIDKGAKKAAIAKMTEGGTDPSGVKSQELGITHLAGSHQKLAVTSARHVAGNRIRIGRVGKVNRASCSAAGAGCNARRAARRHVCHG